MTDEQTFIAVKPDLVQRAQVGNIIKRFEQRGYKLVALKLTQATPEQAKTHYEDLASKPFFNDLVAFFSSGPIVAMIWEGEDAVIQGRRLLGETDPKASAPGSLRGDFTISMGRNGVHGSDSVQSAQREIDFWFPDPSTRVSYAKSGREWVYEDTAAASKPSSSSAGGAPKATAAAAAAKTDTGLPQASGPVLFAAFVVWTAVAWLKRTA